MVNLVPKNISPTTLSYKSLRFVGLLNQEGRPWSYLITAYHFIILKLLVVSIVLQLLWTTPDLPDIIQALSWITIWSHVYTKLVNMLCHQTEVRQMLDRIEEIRNEIYQEYKYQHFLTDSDSLLIKLIEYYCTFFVSYPVISLAMNLVGDYVTGSEEPHLILPVWMPWNMKEFWPYLGGMLYVTIFPITTTFIYAAICIFQFTFTFQISAFVKVLRAKLEGDRPNNQLYRQHAEIIRLLQKYNDLFSGQMYFEILASSVQPCGFGYTLIKIIKRNDPGAFDLIYKILLALSAPLTVCACGQVIRTQFEKLHISTYMGKWYEEKPSVRMDLVMMMKISAIPKSLSFRRYVIFDFVCYASVLQGVYSYLMMISQFDL